MITGLRFNALPEVSLSRAKRWHKGGLATWDIPRWSNAAAGEMGECCNAVKKLDRIDCAMQQSGGDSGVPIDRADAVRRVAKEIGDTIIYLDLLAQRIGIPTEDCVREAFNQISEREGFPERL